MKHMRKGSVVDCSGVGFAMAAFLHLVAGCTSGATARHDAGTCGTSGTNAFQGFNWLDAGATMLGGSANIAVNDGKTTDQCIPNSASAGRGFWGGEFNLGIGINGVRGQGQPCQVTVVIPLDSSGGLSDNQYAFDPSLAASPDEVAQLSYYASGYFEYGDGDPNDYPAPGVSAWTGTSTIECFPPVGGMLRGTFVYDGTDFIGARRKVNATYSVPRYPDSVGVVVPDGGVP